MLRQAWESCKSVIFLCIILAVVTAANTVAELLIAPSVLKKVETSAPLSELFFTIVGFGGILLILAGLKAYIQENTLYGRVEVRSSLIRQLGGKLAGTSYPNLLDTKFMDIKSKAYRICSGNSEATEAIWNTWTQLLTNLLGFLAYLYLLSGLNPLLAGLVTLTAVAGFFLNKSLNEWGYRHRGEAASCEKQMDYICRMSSQRTCAKDIRIFGLHTWLTEVWNDAFHLYQSFLSRREKVYIWTNVLDLLLSFLRGGIAYAYLIKLALSQGLPASEFLLYFNAVGGFTQWITGILENFTCLHKQSLDISTLREFLEWQETFLFEDGEPLHAKPEEGYELRLEDVSFRYPDAVEDTLSHVSLTIHPGENLAVVGTNGAGKTTLVKLLCGFLDPTEGRVLLNGQDIRRYNRRDYYALFCAVFQNFSVLEASIAENVAQRTEHIDEQKVRTCLHQAGLIEMTDALPQGLHTKVGRQVYEDGVELSGGQTQRLILARALYKDGPIVILDEPTAALDPIAENEIYIKYRDMTKGRTSVFISHRLASTRFCDRIIFLDKGQIAEEGTHESLLSTSGLYAGLFEIQSRYYRDEKQALL